MPPALATNMSPPQLPPMVSLNSTKGPLMLRLRLPLPTMVDTMAIPDTDTTVSDTDMVVIMADTDTVVRLLRLSYDVVKNQWRGHKPLFPSADDFKSFGLF